jgi:hypothetical protein
MWDLMSSTPLFWGLVFCCVRLLSVSVGKEKVQCFCKIELEKDKEDRYQSDSDSPYFSRSGFAKGKYVFVKFATA